MKKRLLLWISLLLLFSGCAPKIGKIHAMNEKKSESTAEISIIRNGNVVGSAIRYYPTVNDKKIVGLYTNDYVHFYLKEGEYKFGLTYPDVAFGRWMKGNFIKKEVKAGMQYYFLLSPTLLFTTEIEEVDKEAGEEMIPSSKLVKTGKLSDNPSSVAKAVKPIGHILGIEENMDSAE